MERTGSCMCGEVKFKANFGDTFGACYCEMCCHWSSGAFMGASSTEFEITEGKDGLTVFKSSPWAERAFCSVCGSNIYYHATEYGGHSIAMGALDDTSGLTIGVQYFIDKKPEGFSLEQQTKVMTEAEIQAIYGGS